MAKSRPAIVTVDDEPDVLNAIERDLRSHFRGEFRIIKASSGAEAIDAIRTLKERGQVVALFVADQRMPAMAGTEFLAEAKKFFPEARKVLLTAYADTEAAIESINTVGLDHYLMKPWDPPDQNLYPVLDDLIEEWQSTAPVPYDGIRVAGTQWSSSSHEMKDFLARNRVPYRWQDIESDEEARLLVESLVGDEIRLPVVFFPDGKTMVAPDRNEVANKLGMKTKATGAFYDLVVVGAGPAGLAAGVYGASEGLKTVVIEKDATGGQAGTSSRIENYLGFPKGLSGSDLARRATAQAERLGTEILVPQEAVSFRVEDPYKIVSLADGTEISCYALVLAPGVSVRRLEVPGVANLTGAGVFYGAALTEAAHYRGEQVFVVGAANSAGQGAMFFSRYASKVTMLVRGEGLQKSMSHYLIEQITGTPNIEVIPNTEVVEAKGENALEKLVLKNRESGELAEREAKAMFVFIGTAPHTEFVKDVVAHDSDGFVLTGQDLLVDGRMPKSWSLGRLPMHLESSVPGVFAAGDARSGSSKRVAASTGEGAVAVQLVHQYIKTV